jgi:hypothetical protein
MWGDFESSDGDRSPFERDVLLKGSLLVRVTAAADGRPVAGAELLVGACGFK